MKLFKMREDQASILMEALNCYQDALAHQSVEEFHFTDGSTPSCEALKQRIQDSVVHILVLDMEDVDMLAYAAVTTLPQEKQQKCLGLLDDVKNTVRGTDFILSSDGSCRGVVINAYSRSCRMEGCTGHRMYVRWQDGAKTFPCSKGCSWLTEHLCKIG